MGQRHSHLPMDFLLGLLKTPRILKRTAKGLFRKHVSVKYDYNFLAGKSSKISQISLKITNLCNLRCKMCGQWGEKGYNLTKPNSELREVVPLEVYKKMVDDVAHLKPIIYIWGGEPFLYPDLMPLTSYMKEKDFILSIVTNGVKLQENAEEIVDKKWEALMLSLDGPKEIHNEIRGSENCFDTLAKGIDKIQTIKRKKNSTLPYVMLLVTVSRDNYEKLPEIFDIAKEVGADCVVVYYAWFTDEKTGEKHTELFKKYLDCEPSAWKSYVQPVDRIDTEVLKESVRKIQKTKYPFPYIFIPDLKLEDIPTYYGEPGNFMGYGNCLAPWMTVEIMPNGDITPCRDYPDYIVGNIMKDPILDIFNNERYQKFRKALKEDCEGNFPICSRCCGLMGF